MYIRTKGKVQMNVIGKRIMNDFCLEWWSINFSTAISLEFQKARFVTAFPEAFVVYCSPFLSDKPFSFPRNILLCISYDCVCGFLVRNIYFLAKKTYIGIDIPVCAVYFFCGLT